ncbi:MAG: 30S ribosomal protein S15, partial [Candidatus Aenigmatarchaeota archaeon]
MARMYSRKHGKSGSTRPLRKDTPDWVDLSEDEVEEKVVELAEEGKDPSQIGVILRDRYGIPTTKDVVDKSVTEILEENDAKGDIPEDLRNLLE